MRKSKFSKLFTVALPLDLYELVKELSDQREISMGEVVRNSVEYSMHYDGSWMAAKENKAEVKSTTRPGGDLTEGIESISEENCSDTFNFNEIDF